MGIQKNEGKRIEATEKIKEERMKQEKRKSTA